MVAPVDSAAILRRVIDPERGSMSPELAKFVLELDFPPADHARTAEQLPEIQSGGRLAMNLHAAGGLINDLASPLQVEGGGWFRDIGRNCFHCVGGCVVSRTLSRGFIARTVDDITVEGGEDEGAEATFAPVSPRDQILFEDLLSYELLEKVLGFVLVDALVDDEPDAKGGEVSPE